MVAERLDTARVILWGRDIGAVYWDRDAALAAFEYDPDFVQSGIELAPLMMPLGPGVFRFPALRRGAFRGLPGLLADSLPDDFGNAIIDQWLLREGRTREDFSPVERLCYIGRRGTGALEFRPATRKAPAGSVPLRIASLVDLAQAVLAQRSNLEVSLGDADSGALDDMLRVGTSAGGARAKAVVAWNPVSGKMRSGQVKAPPGYGYWILKFDGVDNRQHGLRDPQGYGRIEYAYHLMAVSAGITMTECRLLEENGRCHFMTRRFDRSDDGDKIHMQSLCALAHLDNELAGAHGYEQAFDVMRKLALTRAEFSEQFRRMAFNVVARNQDDHTKNIAFLMDRDGRWSLSPAFDVIYAYNPQGEWTRSHQMTINGLRDNFSRSDLLAVAERFDIRDAAGSLRRVEEAVGRWAAFAAEAGVPEAVARQIAEGHRKLY